MNDSDEYFGKKLTVYGESMTNDQQQVEAWRIEFEATVDHPEYLKRFPSGTYLWDSTEWMWAGFQRAKRNQPVIELPNILLISTDYAKELITAAGYTYTVAK